jgi:UDP-N-acetylglucosamine--N-acetylmuramyl-(pentapeptide) pyrophosphoryl-undecaprenol N-acetylglucosamine transferase
LAKLSDEKRQLRICLAASGGGHIRQLLDLAPAWSKYDYFFVSEDTALSRSLTGNHSVFFLSHFALGQVRRDGLIRTISSGLGNLLGSIRLVLKHRPDVVISTGAGTVFFVAIFAKILGAKFFLIETFARFDRPSSFTRAAAWFADDIVVQSATLGKQFPSAAVFDPLEILATPRPPKKNLLFATVGVTFPFDRLIEMVGTLKENGTISQNVVCQTGIGGIAPAGTTAFETLPFEAIKAYLHEADIVVCHGGTGSVITALREGCRTIVVPRSQARGEHYDNHQQEITDAFAARGLVVPANSVEELRTALERVRSMKPVSATTNPTELIEHLNGLLLLQASSRGRRQASAEG